MKAEAEAVLAIPENRLYLASASKSNKARKQINTVIIIHSSPLSPTV